MEFWKLEYKKWIDCDNLPADIKSDLSKIKDKEDCIKECFYKNLQFGTSGLRGEMGPGSSKINSVVISKVSRGFGEYIKAKHESPHVIIGYDSRNKSRAFAYITARVLAEKGVRVSIFQQLVPVSQLSYEIRRMGASGGVMITASHNPKEYNGYKVYNSYGGQILPKEASEIYGFIEKEEYIDSDGKYKGPVLNKEVPFLMEDRQGNPRYKEFTHENIEWIYRESTEAFVSASLGDYIESADTRGISIKDLKVVYSPLNGAGLVSAKKVFHKLGIDKLYIVKSQEFPDGDFPTCPLPNPEKKEVYAEGQKLLQQINGDILLVTDPDCDRIGMAIKERIFTGNELALLIFEYMCRKKRKSTDQYLVRNMVSTEVVDEIAKDYGIKIKETPVGFKYISRIAEDIGEEFFFGFEEGNGYLVDTHTRDKDGISTARVICEMAAEYKKEKKTFEAELKRIYKQYGFYKEKVSEYVFSGVEGENRRKLIMQAFRNKKEGIFKEEKVISVKDYQQIDSDINVLEFFMEKNRRFIVRPSGTEPKMKIYIFAKDSRSKSAEKKVEKLDSMIAKVIMEMGI